MDIGKNIQTIRYANKLTQDQVIAKLNLMGILCPKVPMPSWKPTV